MKHERPEDMPGRVCRALEGYALVEPPTLLSRERLESFYEQVYKFTHIASGTCPHPHWQKEFERFEADVEEAVFTSPVERIRRAEGK